LLSNVNLMNGNQESIARRSTAARMAALAFGVLSGSAAGALLRAAPLRSPVLVLGVCCLLAVLAGLSALWSP
jgi:hypothetical protein